MDCKAEFLSEVLRMARVREESFAALAAEAGEPFVRDIVEKFALRFIGKGRYIFGCFELRS